MSFCLNVFLLPCSYPEVIFHSSTIHKNYSDTEMQEQSVRQKRYHKLQHLCRSYSIRPVHLIQQWISEGLRGVVVVEGQICARVLKKNQREERNRENIEVLFLRQ